MAKTGKLSVLLVIVLVLALARSQRTAAQSGGNVYCTPNTIAVGQATNCGPVTFATGGQFTLALDFGDGSSPVPLLPTLGGTASHTYTSPGTYTVTLLVTPNSCATCVTPSGTTTVTVTGSTQYSTPSPGPAPMQQCSDGSTVAEGQPCPGGAAMQLCNGVSIYATQPCPQQSGGTTYYCPGTTVVWTLGGTCPSQSGNTGGSPSPTYAAVQMEQPACSQTSESITWSWDAVNGATMYFLQISTSDVQTSIGSLANPDVLNTGFQNLGTSVTVGATPGTMYYAVVNWTGPSKTGQGPVSKLVSIRCRSLPFPAGQTWYVCQGYNGYIDHVNELATALDLSIDPDSVGSQGCTPATSDSSTGSAVTAPAAGKILNYLRLSDFVCLSFTGGGSMKIGHITNRLPIGTAVSAGDTIGDVAPAGFATDQGDYAHIHMQAFNSSDCSGAGVPFDAADNAGFFCAPDMPRDSNHRNQWATQDNALTSC